MLDASLHQVCHSDIICVVTQTHVLQVGHQHVEFVHAFLAWAVRFAVVERSDRNTGFFVNAAANVFAGIGFATETVFGRENLGHFQTVFEHHVEHVLALRGDAGLVAQQGNAFALEQRHVLVDAVGCQHHRGGGCCSAFVVFNFCFLLLCCTGCHRCEHGERE